MPQKKSSARTGKPPQVRPWRFAEVPVGDIIEFEDKSWIGTVSIRREIITGVSQSGDDVVLDFGGETHTVQEMLSPEFRWIRDGQKFPCAVQLNDFDALSELEKFRIAREFASMICAQWLFIRDFQNDTLVLGDWLSSAKRHKLLISGDGTIEKIWCVNLEKEPDLSFVDLNRTLSVDTAFSFIVKKLGLLRKLKSEPRIRAAALDDPE